MRKARARHQAILFDLDGTLLDTAPDFAVALNRVRAEDGLEPLPLAAVRPHVSHGSYALTRLGFGLAADLPAFESRRQRLLAAYHSELAHGTRLFPGMEEVLRHIEDSGGRWGIVTNKPGWLTTPLLAALDLAGRAACVIAGDNAARPKPYPDSLLAAAAKLELPTAACLYVGDAERDVAAALAAGMPVLVALYGYLGPDDDPRAWGGDGTIATPRDLLSWI